MQNNMSQLISLCRRRGIIYPGSEIYGGLANSWHFGPLGAQIKKNIKDLWWSHFVEQREDILGLDSSIIMNPQVWQGSGHLQNFNDPLVECKNCHSRFRSDQLLEDDQSVKDGKIVCPNCADTHFTQAQDFNLMFKTFIGPTEKKGRAVYLRPETAQGMFVDFKIIQQAYRKRLPFGIAQIGKAFRNEITPRNFIFRTLEFEQMEIEYFIRPRDWKKYFDEWKQVMQEWLIEILGIKKSNFTIREHKKDELSHYSKRTIDFEYKFPFGTSELYGLAYRTDFDLKAHQQESRADLRYQDPETGKKFFPHVLEPSFGLERTVLAVLLNSLTVVRGARTKTTHAKQEEELVLKLNKKLAPIKIAFFPLARKPKLINLARRLYQDFSQKWISEYNETGSIGKRYRLQDEIGTPYCITIDFQSLEDKKVTVRQRDTMEQKRVSIEGLERYLEDEFKGY